MTAGPRDLADRASRAEQPGARGQRTAPATDTDHDDSVPVATRGAVADPVPRGRRRWVVPGTAAVLVLSAVIGVLVAAPWSTPAAPVHPAVADARLTGSWTATYKVTSLTGMDWTGAKTWSDVWIFTPVCPSGACDWNGTVTAQLPGTKKCPGLSTVVTSIAGH
jgi:hypothetical protein